MNSLHLSAEIVPTDKEEVAFKDLDAAILVGSMPRRDGMERKDLLKANVAIFKSQGTALEKYAKKTVKVMTQDLVYRPAQTCKFTYTPLLCHLRSRLFSETILLLAKLRVLRCFKYIEILNTCCKCACAWFLLFRALTLANMATEHKCANYFLMLNLIFDFDITILLLINKAPLWQD